MTNRIEKGQSIYSLVLQPGWTTEEDGFGLLTSRMTFVYGHGSDTDSADLIRAPRRGDSHPKDLRMTCHRATTTYNANGIAVVVAEYIGIADGNTTRPDVSGRGNMSTDPITTHPKFVEVIGGTSDAPKNGAVFGESDGLFRNFDAVPPGSEDEGTANTPGYIKRGVRSYLNPGFGISGHLYTNDMGFATALKETMGMSSRTGIYGGVCLLGDIQSSNGGWGQWNTGDGVPQLLLTGLAVDFFGTVVKVSYDLTYAPYGWDYDIYENLS